MKTLICSCAFAALSAAVAAAEITWDGRIDTVTVYTNGFAQVTRAGEAAMPEGVAVIKSGPLPPSADLASIYVAVQGEGVSVQSVETRRELVADKELEAKLAAFREEYRKQDDALFLAQQALAVLDDKINSRRETLAFLAKMRENSAETADAEMAAQKLDADAWQKAIEMAQAQAEKARAEIRELTAKRREAEHRVWEEEQRLDDILRKAPKGCGIQVNDQQTQDGNQAEDQRNYARRQTSLRHRLLRELGVEQTYQTRVFITLAAKAATRAKVLLSYNVQGADWEPNYRVSADLKAKTAALDIFGVVRQSSGEDWKNAQIFLSTARADLGTDVPVLMPWYIRTARLVPLPLGARRTIETESDEEGEERPPALAAIEEALVTGTATVFACQGRTTIPSDNESHRIPVSSLTSPVEVEYVAIPKILPHAFIQAKLANRAAFALIPGVMEVIVGGSYVGRGMMKAAAPGEIIKLSLGVDEQVKMRMALVEDKGERKVRGGRAQSTNVFAITAANYKDEEIKLTIIDQLPISRDSRVVVTYGAEAKRALRGAEFPGQLKWEIALAAKKTQTIEFDFTIEYPEEMRQALEEYNRSNIVEYQYEKVTPEAAAGQRYRKEVMQGKAAADAKF